MGLAFRWQLWVLWGTMCLASCSELKGAGPRDAAPMEDAADAAEQDGGTDAKASKDVALPETDGPGAELREAGVDVHPPVCEPGMDLRCSAGGDAIEICKADGSGFEPQSQCPGFCIGAACRDCKPNTRRCEGMQPQVCDEAGTWIADGPGCETQCNSNTGLCLGCAPQGTKKCVGLNVFVCSPQDDWTQQSTCDANAGCIGGLCTSCQPGVHQPKCESEKVLQCNREGSWETKQNCPFGCSANSASCRTCTPGSKRCMGSGGRIEECNSTGSAWDARDCPGVANASPTCVDGQCTFTCNEGFTKCADSMCRRECPSIVALQTDVCDSLRMSADGGLIVGIHEAKYLAWPNVYVETNDFLPFGLAGVKKVVGSLDGLPAQLVLEPPFPPAQKIWTNAPSGTLAMAVAGSSDGQTIIGTKTFPEPAKVLRWTVQNGVTLVADGHAVDVSNDGKVIVARKNSDAAFAWSETGGTRFPPAVDGAYLTELKAISGDGRIACGRASLTSGVQVPYCWTLANDAKEVLSLLPGGTGGMVYGLDTEGGDRVGSVWNQSEHRAVIWRSGQISSLHDRLQAAGVSVSEWALTAAHGVSADGRVVVGCGSKSGSVTAFRAVLP